MTPVSEHYQREVVTIGSDSPVRDAADLMKAKAVGSLVVLEAGKPVGIVTDRDLLERVIAQGMDGLTRTRAVMSEPLYVAAPSDPLDRVIGVMSEHSIRRVPVVRNGELMGIVSLDDVLIELGDEMYDIAESRRREIHSAERSARTRELARELGERMRDLGEQIEDLGSEAKSTLVRELDGLRERIRGRKH